MQQLKYNCNTASYYYEHNEGFSLIELLLVLVITAILITVSVPSYESHLNKGKRLVAQQDLLALSQVLENYYLEHYSYLGATLNTQDDGGLPFSDYSPSSEPEHFQQYTLVIEHISENGESYTLTANPISHLAAQGQGALYYFSDGRKAWDKNNNGRLEQTEFCWRCE